jgi:hypothetical protein
MPIQRWWRYSVLFLQLSNHQLEYLENGIHFFIDVIYKGCYLQGSIAIEPGRISDISKERFVSIFSIVVASDKQNLTNEH